eukprot:8360026-Heterocapsa_arctica.AAC.1
MTINRLSAVPDPGPVLLLRRHADHGPGPPPLQRDGVIMMDDFANDLCLVKAPAASPKLDDKEPGTVLAPPAGGR